MEKKIKLNREFEALCRCVCVCECANDGETSYLQLSFVPIHFASLLRRMAGIGGWIVRASRFDTCADRVYTNAMLHNVWHRSSSSRMLSGLVCIERRRRRRWSSNAHTASTHRYTQNSVMPGCGHISERTARAMRISSWCERSAEARHRR